ncbi:hypothetical protein EH31_14585 [Erythrobacter longus]|uniref:Flagellar motor switch protein FliN n=1 Tax=Erythrobacter longus TaxID=1044 RepID=A0A074M3R2_ERYLO|nr:flagellar motor switch protein FliN [Erythrobacter longus]KEO89251.1 hypothetical protein EH31_14585 [Erythrobacter longus]
MSALSHTLNPALQRLGEVSVRLSVELGRTQMALKDVLALTEGSVVSLDKLTDELLDITANGQVIAHGEVIAQDGKFALRIVSLAGGDEPVRAPPRTSPTHTTPASGPRPDVPNSAPTSPATPNPPSASDMGASDIGASPQQAADAAAASQDAPASVPPIAEEPEVDPLLDALDDLTGGLGPSDDQSSQGATPEQGGPEVGGPEVGGPKGGEGA